MAFGQYAQFYDIIYRKKKYTVECLYLERLFKKYSEKKVKTVLDLGCGTASHMVPLLKKGYDVTGIDASAGMLKSAREKLMRSGLQGRLHRAKLQTFRLNQKYDAVLCLFSVIDYLTRKKDISVFLDSVARHMKKSSLFIFDFWQAGAVREYYTPSKINIFKDNGYVLERKSWTTVVPAKNICEVQYTCTLRQKGKPILKNREKHILRYFSIEEMQGYLKTAGMKTVNIHPFLNIGGKIKKNTWDVTMVAQKA